MVLGHPRPESSPGAALALVHAFISIHLRADQIVSGTAVNFLALGITGYFFIDVYTDQGTPGDVESITPTVQLLVGSRRTRSSTRPSAT